MEWINFNIYAYTALILWLLAAFIAILPTHKIIEKGKGIQKLVTKIGSILPVLQEKKKMPISNILTILGLLILGGFLTMLWIKLDRPPMRTLGETRLWYAFFLPFIGIITFNRWKFGWFLSYSNLLAILFLSINLAHPENYSKTLMPALQSPWFVPHVVVYIFSYALLGVSSLVAIYGVFLKSSKTDDYEKKIKETLSLADNLVYTGFAFLTLGLLFGALWAKEAWGHYWTWDPKETWAFLTFLAYLTYMHFRFYHKNKVKIHLWILGLSFAILLLAWFGVNYMPSAANSVHTYTQ